MASKTTFAISGQKERNALKTKYTIKRDADPIGQPSSDIQGGICEVSFASNENNGELATMINDPTKNFSASIKYMSDTDDSTMKELKMEEAYIIDFHEHIDVRANASPESAMVTSLIISARKIGIGNADFENSWPKA